MTSSTGLLTVIGVCLLGAAATFLTYVRSRNIRTDKGLSPQKIVLLVIYIVMAVVIVRFIRGYISEVEAEVGAAACKI